MALLYAVKRNKKLTIIAGVVWLSLLASGFTFLLTYSNKPGAAGSVSKKWPSKSSIRKNSENFTLLLFAHPKCPCTSATASELERLLASIHEKPISTYVFLYSPADAPESWSNTTLREKFEGIPNVKVIVDTDGVEAGKFGAMTSGQTFLYSKDGSLLFKGGITESRGHEGDNAGREAIASFVLDGKSAISQTPVFGCSIRKPASTGWKAQ
jgi:hypothetical protein